MALSNEERQRYGEANYNASWHGLDAPGPWNCLPGPTQDFYSNGAAAVVSARDADRTAALIGIVRGWREEAVTRREQILRRRMGRDPLPQLDRMHLDDALSQIEAYDKMLALLDDGGDG